MARACTICTNTKRSEIELSVANGASNRAVALQFSVGHMAVQRHMAEHISKQAEKLQAMREEAETIDVLARLIDLHKGTWTIWEACRRSKKTYGLALSASDRITKQLELYAKLQGDLASGPQINIQLPAPWADIELAIAGALSVYPDAAVAVSDALARMEAGSAGLN